MFYVFNKSKIYSYIIALCTVVILFVAATTLNDMASPSGEMVETGANTAEVNTISNVMGNKIDNKKNNEIKNNIVNE